MEEGGGDRVPLSLSYFGSLGSVPIHEKCSAQSPGFHDIQQNSSWLGKFSKQVLLVIHSNHRTASKTLPSFIGTGAWEFCHFPGMSYKTHSQLTAWNYVTGLLSLGACLSKNNYFHLVWVTLNYSLGL